MIDPEVKPRLLEFIIEPTPMTPGQYGDYIQTETVKWGKVVRESGVTIE